MRTRSHGRHRPCPRKRENRINKPNPLRSGATRRAGRERPRSNKAKKLTRYKRSHKEAAAADSIIVRASLMPARVLGQPEPHSLHPGIVPRTLPDQKPGIPVSATARALLVLSVFLASLIVSDTEAAARYVTIVSPSRGATVSGTVRWSATARPRPRRVAFRVDGSLVRVDRTAPYVYRWDTARVRNGYHRLAVRAFWRVRSTTGTTTTSLTARRRVKVHNPSPASYFTGPLGANNILPPRKGAFLGIAPQGSWAEQRTQVVSREQFVGRRFDFVHLHYGAPTDVCYWIAPFSQGREKWVADRGSMPIISWTHGWTLDEVNAGLADACFRDVGRRFAAWGRRILLRSYWEFNGTWFPWSGTGAKFINAWKRTVDVMRSAGATNVGFVWCPDEGNFPGTNESYPGDAYVDWVCSDKYNWNKSTSYCRAPNGTWHAGWCEFEESFHDGSSIERLFGPRKPYMVGETASVEDLVVPGRKGEWHRNARDAIKARFLYLKAYLYYDAIYGLNWPLDTSLSSLLGFRDLARDSHFNTR